MPGAHQIDIPSIRGRYTDLPPRFAVVNIASQTLSLVDNKRVLRRYPISTSAHGAGAERDSFRTPLGKHRIARKIGDRAAAGTIFTHRTDTGRRWQGERVDDDLIVSRILQLEGLEDGVNRGPGVDSLERCIYIHGTNHEDRIGTPSSHGCIRMRNADIIELFDSVSEGTIVVIDRG